MDTETQKRLRIKKRELHLETMQKHIGHLVEMIEKGLIPEEALGHFEHAQYHLLSSILDDVPKPPSRG